MKNIILALLSTIVLSTMVPHIGPVDSHAPLTYKMELNDPPLKRWEPIYKDFKEPIDRFIEYLDLLPISKTFYDGV